VRFQVLDPPMGSFESLCLCSWPRVCFNIGLCFLFIIFYDLKNTKESFTYIFLV
jgi:hypothetical protein